MLKAIKVLVKTRKALLTTLVVAVLLLCGIVVVQQGAIYKQLDEWMLIPRPDRLTELYFSSHQDLAESYSPGVSHELQFTVHNIEHVETIYHYEIVQDDEGGGHRTVLLNGSLVLSHDDLKNIKVQFTPIDTGVRTRVSVVVTYDGIKLGEDKATPETQSIYYLMNKTAANANQIAETNQ